MKLESKDSPASHFRLASALFSSHRMVLLVLSLSALIGACGGGGGGGGTNPPPPPTQPPPPPTASASYTSDATTTTNSVALTSSVAGQQITLTVRASSVTNLNGLAFDLTYPANQLTFDSGSELSAFAGAESTSFELFQQPGRLVVGLARLGSSNGFNGSGDLLSFTFTAGTSGSGRVDFENRDALRADGTVIGNLDWIGGTLTVN